MLRLDTLGIKTIKEVIVNSRINYMDGHISQSVVPCHTLNKRILPFGVAARMVHPSTVIAGYSVVASLFEDPDYASDI